MDVTEEALGPEFPIVFHWAERRLRGSQAVFVPALAD